MSVVLLTSQASWNRLCPNLLASAHESEVFIWDTRRPGAGPERFGGTVAQGGSTIRSLDWNPTLESELVTSW